MSGMEHGEIVNDTWDAHWGYKNERGKIKGRYKNKRGEGEASRLKVDWFE